jgi:hypothetical protein
MIAIVLFIAGLAPVQKFTWHAEAEGSAVREFGVGVVSPLASLRQTGEGSLSDIRWNTPKARLHLISWSALFVLLGVALICRPFRP